MPIVEITLIEGRNKEQKTALFKAVTEAIVTSIGAPAEAVRIIIREVPPEHFAVAGIPKG
jgi:4-oxalocrotonate tautomerase